MNNPPQIHCDQALFFDDVFLQTEGSVHQSLSLISVHSLNSRVMFPQESTVITCAHKASGDPTVQSAVPVRTEDPALQKTVHVCAHLATGGRPAKEVRHFFLFFFTPSNLSGRTL